MTPHHSIHLKLFIATFLCVLSFSAQSQKTHKQLFDKGIEATDSMNYQRALMFFEDALIISKDAKDTSQIVGDLVEIGMTYLSMDEMDNSLNNYLAALRISEDFENDSITFEVQNKLAFYYMEFEDLVTAKQHLDHAKKLAGMLGDKTIYYLYYNSLGIFERRSSNFDASIQAYKKSLEYLSSNMLEEKFNTLVNLSTVYAYNNEVEKAYSFLLRAQEINKTLANDWYELVLYGQLGRTKLLLKDVDGAIEYYLKGLEVSKETDNKEMSRRFNRELARANATRKNYKMAYFYYTQFVKELQEFYDQEKAGVIAEMSAKYEHEKNQQRIEHLEEEDVLKEQIHKDQIERRNLWILIASVVLVLVLIISIIVFKNQRNKQRLKLELIEKQKELAKQESEIKGQEAERERLSRELHDGLGGTLASIKMRLSSKNIDEIHPILNDIDAACQDVRNMSHSLSSKFINEVDFYSLLAKLTDDIRQRSALDVKLEFMPLEELNQLESESKHQCYRIIQELTNNAVKHARASKLTIGLMKNENEVILLIEDDGIGFDVNSLSDGIGLNNVRKRLENLRGSMDISSVKNEGSTFSISFPFIKEYEN